MVRISRNGTSAFIGIPPREAIKLEELWGRDELGVELSVDVHAPVVIGVYPMRIARYLADSNGTNGTNGANGHGGADGSSVPDSPDDADSESQAD